MPTTARFLILIPAHDEEETIQATVESCRAIEYDQSQFAVCVIADNCSDGTALVAREAGAEVVERVNLVKRSKGYALEYFFERGPLSEYDAVVIVDADTVVDPGILQSFASGLAKGWDWIQCYHTVRNADASWRTRVMTYAFSLFNGVRPMGFEQLGLGAAFNGNGMCFSTSGLARVPWRAYSLAEDLEFSWTLRLAGERIHFEPHVRVLADMLTRGGSAASAQRRRWEVGRTALRRRVLGPLLRSHNIGPFRKGLYVIELFFPPLSVLFAALLLAASVHLVAVLDPRLLPLSRLLRPAHAVMAATLMAYTLSPLLVMRLPVRYLASLLALPYFMGWKTTVALGRRPSMWVRTWREPSCRSPGSG
ncbi:glycosyltransferase family 2 protein [Singulisphaera sp. Ch08]|uniref:Glycosyltransferase family 2 protein n=1 Tax=Singulisphaera sp. Ch08 TaxID=3120278 RepID=A0AAU7CEJ0_9BACT